ncbi:LPD1 domain-containing protein [Enterococcus gallinarum]|uniref:Large polyvalent protein-associated domain-containing protein n=1 Tax=Enterococcus gallinarum TaxID=1353 RepID=A0ABD4HN05_ENTGA|nr:LPD1 domain-containing protein [Enterococcus gallinarum]MBA0947990.1 hypothetical protein [Enterococcus gallinarum]MBA0961517.1 hypothetical protein [Enterococcus gallinarum]MBA0969430.1 hypothetical protein [Enterococcus gallinarum]MBA0972803.1 hypothetical protein [Enterococcus gallinarum]NVI94927.1 hypothetical protein [Enterococcus gallinarum]
MDNQLTSLLKKKYGTTTSSPVVFTEKDTLYTAFRKLADNIYRNGSWAQEDELRAVDTFVRNRYGYPVGKEDSILVDGIGQAWSTEVKVKAVEAVESPYLVGKAKGMKVYSATSIRKEIDGSKDHIQTINVLLDPTNKTGTKHGEFYYISPSGSKDLTYYALGNMNRAIGYDKLQRDILKEFDDFAQESKFGRRDLERLLEQLSIASYTGKKNARLFQKNPHGELTDEFLTTLPRDEGERYRGNPSQMAAMIRNQEVPKEDLSLFKKELNATWGDLTEDPTSPVKVNLDKSPYLLKEGYRTTYLYPKNIEKARIHNHVIDFVENYIQTTYDILLQREYEKDIDKQTRASAWQTKKNINKETRKIMESTTLNKYFRFIEIDNDVDLGLFSQFEKEMERMHSILPKTGDTLPELRLRKLGNHHALGLYVPQKNTIAIDFRDTNDDIGGVGLQSFVHEYGHALDYATSSGLLSMRDDFKPIVARYRENLSLNGKGTYVANKAEYYTAPTEVFARAFELYVSEAGLNSIFLKSKEIYETNIEYSLFDEQMREKVVAYFDHAFPDLRSAIMESNKGALDFNSRIVNEQADLFGVANLEIENLKSTIFRHENKEITLGEAMENCELSLVDKATAIQKQMELIQLYRNAIPQTDTMTHIAAIHEETLEEMKEQSEETLFLFDGTELAVYLTDAVQLMEAIEGREVFYDVYGYALSEGLSALDLSNDFSKGNEDRFVSEAETQVRKWLLLSKEAQNEILIIHFRNPVNTNLVLMKYGLENVDNLFNGLNNPLQVEWRHRYKDLSEEIKAFDEKRKAWLESCEDERIMYIPESLWEVAEKVGLMENYPKNLGILEAVDLQTEPATVTEEISSDEMNLEDNSRLGQAKRKLSRLKSEYKEKLDQVYAHQELTNGQPMNDKRNGRSWFNRREQLEYSLRNLSEQIQEQEERVAKLEEQKEDAEMGFSKQGGLIMSVENIPRIQEEIKKSKTGNSLFSKDTIRKYEKQLEQLLEAKERSEKAHNHISKHAQELIDAKLVTQWAKNPTVYFVKGLRKVALELQETGEFTISEKYQPQTEKDKEVVASLLQSNEVQDIEANKGNQSVKQPKGVINVPQVQELEERKGKRLLELEKEIETLTEERSAAFNKNDWNSLGTIDWDLHKLKLEVEVLEQSTIEPILRRTAEFEIAIAELEADSYYADSAEGSQREIDSLKEKISDLITLRNKCIESYTLREELNADEMEPIKEEKVNPINSHFIQEINYSFDEAVREIDDLMKENSDSEQEFVNKAELETILENHLKQVEVMIRNSISAIDSMPNLTETQLQSETGKLKRSIGSILVDLKDKIKQYLATKRENTVAKLKNTREDVRLGFKNSFNRKMLTINGLLKQLSNKIDQKFVLEEKQTPADQTEISNPQAHISPQPVHEPGENHLEEGASSVEASTQTIDLKSTDEASAFHSTKDLDQATSDNPIETIEQYPTNEKPNDSEVQQLKRIEELSNQLGLKASDKEKDTIKDLTQSQKSELIRSMEAAIEEKNKSVPAEEVEIEVG